jgi:DNA-binding transcriptional ArsR family regulator
MKRKGHNILTSAELSVLNPFDTTIELKGSKLEATLTPGLDLLSFLLNDDTQHVNKLARTFKTQPRVISRHIQNLEIAQLIKTHRESRRRKFCKVNLRELDKFALKCIIYYALKERLSRIETLSRKEEKILEENVQENLDNLDEYVDDPMVQKFICLPIRKYFTEHGKTLLQLEKKKGGYKLRRIGLPSFRNPQTVVFVYYVGWLTYALEQIWTLLDLGMANRKKYSKIDNDSNFFDFARSVRYLSGLGVYLVYTQSLTNLRELGRSEVEKIFLIKNTKDLFKILGIQ